MFTGLGLKVYFGTLLPAKVSGLASLNSLPLQYFYLFKLLLFLEDRILISRSLSVLSSILSNHLINHHELNNLTLYVTLFSPSFWHCCVTVDLQSRWLIVVLPMPDQLDRLGFESDAMPPHKASIVSCHIIASAIAPSL